VSGRHCLRPGGQREQRRIRIRPGYRRSPRRAQLMAPRRRSVWALGSGHTPSPACCGRYRVGRLLGYRRAQVAERTIRLGDRHRTAPRGSPRPKDRSMRICGTGVRDATRWLDLGAREFAPGTSFRALRRSPGPRPIGRPAPRGMQRGIGTTLRGTGSQAAVRNDRQPGGAQPGTRTLRAAW
jgi:hypothetical protein